MQGVVPADAELSQVAVPASASWSRRHRQRSRSPAGARSTAAPAAALLEGDAAGRFEPSRPTAARRPMTPGEAVTPIAAAAGVTVDPAMRAAGLLAYARTVAPGVVLIALDTADRAGGAAGATPAGRARLAAWRAARGDAGAAS